MYQTLPAEMKNGRITLLDKIKIPNGAHILVTIMQDDDGPFWQNASQPALDKIWANKDDEIYEKLVS